MISACDRAEKHAGEKEKLLVPAFSPFPTMFLNGFLNFQGC